MKKLLLVLAIGSFVACNDGGSAEAEKTAADSAAVTPADSAAVTPAPTLDSTAHAIDSTKKVDSTAKK